MILYNLKTEISFCKVNFSDFIQIIVWMLVILLGFNHQNN